MDHKEMSRKGGLARSPKKTEAVRKNAKKPRRRWVTAFYYQVITEGAILTEGVILSKGKFDKEAVIPAIEEKTGNRVESVLRCSWEETLI